MADDFEVKLNKSRIKNLVHDGNLRKGLEIIGGIAEGGAKFHAPVDTGNLRRSITHDVSRDLRGWFARYGTNVYYGIYQELGTRFHPAHPFLRPAMQTVRRHLSGR